MPTKLGAIRLKDIKAGKTFYVRVRKIQYSKLLDAVPEATSTIEILPCYFLTKPFVSQGVFTQHYWQAMVLLEGVRQRIGLYVNKDGFVGRDSLALFSKKASRMDQVDEHAKRAVSKISNPVYKNLENLPIITSMDFPELRAETIIEPGKPFNQVIDIPIHVKLPLEQIVKIGEQHKDLLAKIAEDISKL